MVYLGIENGSNTPHLYEDTLKQALTDTTKIDKESTKPQNELEVVTEMLRKCVEENACNALEQAEYDERYKALAERYEGIKKGLEGINEKRLDRSAKHESIVAFMKSLWDMGGLVTEFDEELWKCTVEKVVIKAEDKICFKFKDGMELEWNI